MKKSELKVLISEAIQEVLKENSQQEFKALADTVMAKISKDDPKGFKQLQKYAQDPKKIQQLMNHPVIQKKAQQVGQELKQISETDVTPTDSTPPSQEPKLSLRKPPRSKDLTPADAKKAKDFLFKDFQAWIKEKPILASTTGLGLLVAFAAARGIPFLSFMSSISGAIMGAASAAAYSVYSQTKGSEKGVGDIKLGKVRNAAMLGGALGGIAGVMKEEKSN